MRYLFFLLIVFSAASVNAQAEFSVEKSTYKFPKTEEGKLLEHEFEVTNTGNAPLIISDYKVQCKCTKLIYPKGPIAPGQTVKLKVTFDSKGKYGFQDRTLEVFTNTKKKVHKLRIKVNIIPAN